MVSQLITRLPRESIFVVVKASATDSAGILACLREAFEPYRESYTAAGFLDTVLSPEALKERFSSMTIFVARDESNNVVGTIGCSQIDDQEGHIRGMAVCSAWQGRGVAEQLLRAAESELRSVGCRRVTLDTTQPLQRAISFYTKHNYRVSGKVADFFGMPLFEYVKNLQPE
jgi:ribosomal protein S18 acetylase RimI-like enzyme